MNLHTNRTRDLKYILVLFLWLYFKFRKVCFAVLNESMWFQILCDCVSKKLKHSLADNRLFVSYLFPHWGIVTEAIPKFHKGNTFFSIVMSCTWKWIE